MKKLLCVLLIVCFLPVIALSEDFSSMSYDELIELHRQLIKEIMSRPEWKEVEVPAGKWIIGEDIPEGSYSLTTVNDSSIVQVYGTNNYGIPELIYLQEGETYGKLILTAGMQIDISSPVIFAPVKGLGF